MSPSSRCPERSGRGFTLLELAIALLVLAILASATALPLAAQLHQRRLQDAKRQLDEARDAVLAFAASRGRLPCPATPASHGEEAFAAGGGAHDGACADFHAGLLPAAALGLAGLDTEGFARDPWEGERNRVRYAVFAGAINGVEHALTRANGMQLATLEELGAAPHYLFICSSGAAAGASGCGPATNQLTRRAAFVLLSTGPNGARDAPAGSDEARNLDADAVFVAREPGRDFDDLLDWGGILLVVNRMVVAGRLP